MSSFRNPRIDDRSRFYPPTTLGQTKGFRKQKRIPTKRRRRTNLRATGRREEALTMPYRTAIQVKKKPSIYQTATDFLGIHQQALINRARDNREIQRLETAEEKKLKQEQLDLQKRQVQLQEQQQRQQLAIEDKKLSNERLRDRERARSDRVKEVNRRGERQQELDIQRFQTEGQRQLQNAMLYQQGEQARRQQLLDNQNQQVQVLEQQKQLAIQQENNRSQERLAEMNYLNQQNIQRANERMFNDYTQQVNSRIESGERRQGEIEQLGREIIRKIDQQRTNQFDIPSLRTFQESDIASPIPETSPSRASGVIPLPDKQPQGLRQQISAGAESIDFGEDSPPPQIYPNATPVSSVTPNLEPEPEALPERQVQGNIPDPDQGYVVQGSRLDDPYTLDYGNVRDISRSPAFKPTTSGNISQGIADRLNRLSQSEGRPQPVPRPTTSADLRGREAIETLRGMISQPSSVELKPQPRPEPEPELEPEPDEAFNQAQRDLRQQQQEIIDREVPSLTGSSFELIGANPKPQPSPLQLATPREELERSTSLRDRQVGDTGLGGQIVEGIQQGGGLVLDTIGGGLQAGAEAGANLVGGVAQGVGDAVYDATIGQLPTAGEVGEALGRGAVNVAGNVLSEAGRVGGLVGGAVLEAGAEAVFGEQEEERVSPAVLPAVPRAEPLPKPDEEEGEPEPELPEDFEIVEQEQLEQLEDLPQDDPVRIQARLEEYQKLADFSNKQIGIPKNFDGAPQHYRLVVLQDIAPQEIGKHKTSQGFKKGDQYRLQRTDYKGQRKENQGFYFYRDNTGKQMEPKNKNLFKINFLRQDQKIRKLIQEGKIKIVLDEFD